MMRAIRSQGIRKQDGSTVVESVVLVPIAMLIVLIVVQMCLWAHAASLVQNAATAGDQAATALDGSPMTGASTARAELAATAGPVVVDPTVQVLVLGGGTVEVKVSGSTETIIPWLRLPVSATGDGLSQEFRESG
jgi:hypothetical protein